MPIEGTQVRGKFVALRQGRQIGQFAVVESAVQRGPYADYAVTTATGGGNGKLANILPTIAANQTLIPDTDCPTGFKFYPTRAAIAVLGYIPWSVTTPLGIPTLSLVDNLGVPFLTVPFSALGGGQSAAFPRNETYAPFLMGESTVTAPFGAPGVTFLYDATAKTVTASAASFPTSAASAVGLVGAPVYIIDGTGRGGVATVASNTATVLTLNNAFATAPADHASTAKDSVLAMAWQGLKTYTDTTHGTLQNGGGTPFTASALVQNYVNSLAGTAPNQRRKITANTTAGALTLDVALATALDATSVLSVSDLDVSRGEVDLSMRYGESPLAAGSGIYAQVFLAGGTAPLGSPVKIEVDGYFAA